MRASYNQAEYLEERRAMMQQWADMTDSMVKDGNVTPIELALSWGCGMELRKLDARLDDA